MASAVKIAKDKIVTLRAQIIELERFIDMHESLLGGGLLSSQIPSNDEISATNHLNLKREGYIAHQKPVDNSSRRVRWKMRPDHMADLIARVIRESGRPLTRGEIVKALEVRDVPIPFEDKERYIGTIAWRHKGLFENTGNGYRIRGESVSGSENEITAADVLTGAVGPADALVLIGRKLD
jgi:hypothetical protein